MPYRQNRGQEWGGVRSLDCGIEGMAAILVNLPPYESRQRPRFMASASAQAYPLDTAVHFFPFLAPAFSRDWQFVTTHGSTGPVSVAGAGPWARPVWEAAWAADCP